MKSLFRISMILTLVALGASGALAAIDLVADHQDIEGPFKTGPDVTAACLDCHEDAAHDFMKTSHWTWMPMQDVIGKGQVPLGKKNTLNNFCIAVDSNWPRCTSCHAGYGWKDASFDFDNPQNIDCLVCHDQAEVEQSDRRHQAGQAQHQGGQQRRRKSSSVQECCAYCSGDQQMQPHRRLPPNRRDARQRDWRADGDHQQLPAQDQSDQTAADIGQTTRP